MAVTVAVHAQATRAGQPTPADAWAGRAAARLRALHEEADRLAREERTVLGQLRQLELGRQIANEELGQADAAAADAERESDALDVQVQRLEDARAADKPKLEQRLVEMYKLGRGRYARLLLSATDVRRLGQASRTVAALATLDEARMRGYARRLTELDGLRAAAALRRRDLAAKRAAAERAQATAARAIAAQNALVHDIDQRRDLNAQLAGELVAAQQRLEATLKEAGPGSVAELPIGPFRGALPWPAPGTVRRARSTSAAAPQRSGIELQVAEGATVRAVHDGTVAYAGSFEGLGNLVIVDHGGQTFSLYGHLQEVAVGKGVAITGGQDLGRAGVSPLGEPLLYFELRVGGRAVDPLLWLDRTR